MQNNRWSDIAQTDGRVKGRSTLQHALILKELCLLCCGMAGLGSDGVQPLWSLSADRPDGLYLLQVAGGSCSS